MCLGNPLHQNPAKLFLLDINCKPSRRVLFCFIFWGPYRPGEFLSVFEGSQSLFFEWSYFFVKSSSPAVLWFSKRKSFFKKGWSAQYGSHSGSSIGGTTFQPFHIYKSIYPPQENCVLQEWPLLQDYWMTCSTNLLSTTLQFRHTSKIAKLAQTQKVLEFCPKAKKEDISDQSHWFDTSSRLGGDHIRSATGNHSVACIRHLLRNSVDIDVLLMLLLLLLFANISRTYPGQLMVLTKVGRSHFHVSVSVDRYRLSVDHRIFLKAFRLHFQSVFSKLYFGKVYFPNCIFPNLIIWNLPGLRIF